MNQFPEGTLWKTWNTEGLATHPDMALFIGDSPEPITGVIPFNPGYLALNLMSGGPLGVKDTFAEAVATAEAEALNPTYP